MAKSIIALFALTTLLCSSIIMIQDVNAQEHQNVMDSTKIKIKIQPIPDWVKSQFEWYLTGEIDEKTLLTSMNWMFDNNIMYFSQEAAQEVQDMRNEIDDLKYELEETKAAIAIPNLIEARKGANESSASSESGEKVMQPEYGAGDDTQTKVEVRGWDPETKESTLEANKESVQRFVVQLYSDVYFASKTVDDVLRKGGTAPDWEDGIAAFSQHGLRESVVPDLQGIVVLCNIEIDKKTQQIDAELEMIKQWLEIISEKQNNETYDVSGRLASTTESSTQYNQSDLDFITRKLISIDQQVKALDKGIIVLKQKLSSTGDDAQLANIDLQNALQKQQQTLQTISNVSKMQYDTLKSIISNMR